MKIVEKLKSLDKKTVLLGVLVVGVISITIAFAALTSRLNITGTANVAATKWNIHFDNWTNVTQDTVDGHSNTAEYNDNLITQVLQPNVTKISNLNVTLKQPGDYIRYTFKIKNDGTIDGKLNSFTKTIAPTNDVIGYTISCTDENQQDALEVNYVLEKNKSVDCVLEVKYKDIENSHTAGNNQVYEQGVINTNISAEWTWGQADGNSSNSGNSGSGNSGTQDQGEFINNTGWKLLNPGSALLSQQWEYWPTSEARIEYGWHEINDLYGIPQEYYFVNGLAQTGWLNYGGHTYYLSTFDDDNNGYVNCNMLKNESREIDGQCYSFDSNGYATQSNTCGSYIYRYIDTSNENAFNYDASSSQVPNEVMYIKTNQSNTVTQGCVDLNQNGNYFCVDAIWDCVNEGDNENENWVCPNNSYVMQTKARAEAQGASCEILPLSGYLDCKMENVSVPNGFSIHGYYSEETKKIETSIDVSYYYIYNQEHGYGDDEVCSKSTEYDDVMCNSW